MQKRRKLRKFKLRNSTDP